MINLDWAKCGTPGNYRAHHRRGETPCDACRVAHNRYMQDLRRALATQHGMTQREYRRMRSEARRGR